MGESVSEGIVSRWLKAVGDSVEEGEPLVEVTTDKVDVEVPAPATGQLTEIVAAEGETVAVGATLAVIAPGAPPVRGTAPSAAAPEPEIEVASPPPSPPPAEAAAEAAPATASSPPAEAVPAAPGSAAGSDNSEVDAAPLARRAAAKNGVDLHAVHGSGPGGVVTKADVLVAKAGAGPRTDATVRVVDGEDAQPIKGPAAALVDYMERSRDIPTATSFRTIGVGVLDSRRRQLNTALAAGGNAGKVSFTHLIGYAIARAAGLSPAMTAHFARTDEGKPARVAGPAHLGLAVDSVRKDGSRSLVVPVIRDASQLPFKDFRDEYERLIERARGNALSADELQGAT